MIKSQNSKTKRRRGGCVEEVVKGSWEVGGGAPLRRQQHCGEEVSEMEEACSGQSC